MHIRRQRGSSFDAEEQALRGSLDLEAPPFYVDARPATVHLTSTSLQWSHIDAGNGASLDQAALAWACCGFSSGEESGEIPLAEIIGVTISRPARPVHARSASFPSGLVRSAVARPRPADDGQASAKILAIGRPERDRPCAWHPRAITVSCPDAKALDAWCNTLQQAVAMTGRRPQRVLVLVNPVSGEGRSPAAVQSMLVPTLRAAGVDARVLTTRHDARTADLLARMRPAELAGFDGVVAVGGDGAFHELINALLGGVHAPLLRTLRLAHVPTGSTDAVACSLHGCRSAFCASAHVALGPRRAAGRDALHACCIAAAGFMGDICAVAEGYRFLGPLRYDLLGAKTLFFGRPVRATVELCPQPALPPRSAPRRLQGAWRSIMLMVTPCRSDKTPRGMVRHGHLADGRLTAVLVPWSSGPLGMLRMLSHMARHGLAPGELPGVEVIPAAAVSVCAERDVDWNLDGEPVKAARLDASILRGGLRVFGCGVEAPPALKKA
ncbi:hypothetical protein QBZ16_002216 [Prototheca wickerhamii]|uniref:DAGKc domain-containing protein n=1 Tax=Prototheca wickerhamii TaxID=3111 RepID=A0AAD9IJZ0_PROWI|nr:hypothetical protein QBZ16_002216 [Prototheca wickerhamii]